MGSRSPGRGERSGRSMRAVNPRAPRDDRRRRGGPPQPARKGGTAARACGGRLWTVAIDDDLPQGPLRLGPLLRFVDETSATIWVETAEPATVVVEAGPVHASAR